MKKEQKMTNKKYRKSQKATINIFNLTFLYRYIHVPLKNKFG